MSELQKIKEAAKKVAARPFSTHEARAQIEQHRQDSDRNGTPRGGHARVSRFDSITAKAAQQLSVLSRKGKRRIERELAKLGIQKEEARGLIGLISSYAVTPWGAWLITITFLTLGHKMGLFNETLANLPGLGNVSLFEAMLLILLSGPIVQAAVAGVQGGAAAMGSVLSAIGPLIGAAAAGA